MSRTELRCEAFQNCRAVTAPGRTRGRAISASVMCSPDTQKHKGEWQVYPNCCPGDIDSATVYETLSKNFMMISLALTIVGNCGTEI